MNQREHTDVEAFTSRHVAPVLHVATLLTGSRSEAEDLTVEAIRKVAARHDISDEETALRRVYRALLRGWRRRRHSTFEQGRGPLELHDRRPESATATVTAPTADNIIREGLRALSDGERAVLVLHIVAELDLDDVRRVVRRPSRVIRRDLDTSMGFLADASGSAPTQIEARIRQALQLRPRTHDDAAAVRAKLQTLLVADAPGRRGPHPGLIAAVAITTAVVVVAAFMVTRSDDTDDVAGAGDPESAAGSLALPGTPSGLKLVGFKRVMVTVPENWEQATPLCINVENDSVLYPMDDELPPCAAATNAGSSVGFGRYDTVERGVTFKRDHRRLGGESLLFSEVVHDDGEFLQYAALRGANVAISVRSTKRADLAMILASIQEVPTSYVVVPNCLKLDPQQASDLLADNALRGKVFADSSSAGSGIPMRVVTQSPDVGTLLPLDATVNLGVLPR